MEFDMEYNLAGGRMIGQGAFGSVYRCRSSEDSQEWAIKLIEVPDRQEYRMNAEKEVSILMSMESHPNIIGMKRVFAWTNEVTHRYVTAIVLELADRGLFEVFEQRKKSNILFSDEEVISYYIQCIDGLSFLYKTQGLCHRDIKTENLLLKMNKIKISDFGVSKVIHEERLVQMQANTIAGTPLFLAPKVWEAYIKRNEYNVVHDMVKSDVYSLGLVFLQITLLLSNQQLAGFNQADGQKKLRDSLEKVKSNKLRTILAASLVFTEETRAEYDLLKRLINMQESEFTNIIPTSNGGGGLAKFLQPVAAVAAGGVQPPASLSNACYRHNKQIEFFCDCEGCFESLCSDCKTNHTPSHQNVIPYRQAVSKYIDSNQLATQYSQLNNITMKDQKQKLQRYQTTFRDELTRTQGELRKQIQQIVDSAVSRWSTDITNRLSSVIRDADLVQLQAKNEESQLTDSQQKFRNNSTNNSVYLQMIAKQQPGYEKNLVKAKDKVDTLNKEISSLASIDQLYVSFISSVSSVTGSLSNQMESFLNSLVPSSQKFVVGSNGRLPLAASPSSNKLQPLVLVPQSSNGVSPLKNSNQPLVATPKQLSGFLDPSQKSPIAGKPPASPSSRSQQTSSSAVTAPTAPLVIQCVSIAPTKEYKTPPGPAQELLFISQSKSKNFLVTSQPNGKIVKVNLSNDEKSEVQLSDISPRCALFFAASKRILYGSAKGNLFFFDPFSMRVCDQIGFKESQNSPITCLLALEKKPQRVLAGSQDGQVVLWDIEKRVQERVYGRIHITTVTGIATFNNDAILVSISSDRSIAFIDLSTNKVLFQKMDAHSSSINIITKLKDNSFITAGNDGYVKFWEFRNEIQQGQPILSLTLAGENKLHSTAITFLDFLPKYNLIVTSARDGTLFFTDPSNYNKIAIAEQKFLPCGATGVHWDKPVLYTSDNGGNLQSWSIEAFEQTMGVIRKQVQQNNSNCTIF